MRRFWPLLLSCATIISPRSMPRFTPSVSPTRESGPPSAEGLSLSVRGFVLAGHDNTLNVRVENRSQQTIRIPSHLEKWTTLEMRTDKRVREMRGRATDEKIVLEPMMDLLPSTDYEQRLTFPGADGGTEFRLSLHLPEGRPIVETDWYTLIAMPIPRL